MDLFSNFQQLTETAIASLANEKEPINLYAPITYTLQEGGKRIRPLFVLLGHKLFDGKNDQEALTTAVGFEIFHNFSLLHDDIMDKADLRRNRPTVHKKWDENTAILSGDAMMILAYEQFLNISSQHSISILKLFNKTALEVCEGQQYDMDFETRHDVSIDEYLLMIRLKTAVLLAAALKAGALLADASPQQQEQIYEAGIQLGLAFQLQDDYLDTFGNVESFGKKTGGDILEHKKTALLINAYRLANAEQTTQLNNRNLSNEERIATVKKIYTDLKVDQLVKEMILHYYAQSIEGFKNLKGNREIINSLIDYIQKLQNRIS